MSDDRAIAGIGLFLVIGLLLIHFGNLYIAKYHQLNGEK